MNEKITTLQTDILVIGAGGAGGRATIEAARNDVDVILAEKMFMGKSGSTPMAFGRAIRGSRDIDPEDVFIRYLQGGCFLNDQDILWRDVVETPENLRELKKYAEEMKAGPTDSYNNALRYEISKYPNATVLENTIVTKLLMSGGKTVGATALDVVNGTFIHFKVKAVILATGGCNDLYRPSEGAPLGINGGVCGDGQVLAYHAGVDQVEMEMTQHQALPANPKWNLWYRHLLGQIFRYVVMDGPFFDKDGKVIPTLSREAIATMPEGCGPPHAATYRCEMEKQIYLASLKGPVYIDLNYSAKELLRLGRIKDISEVIAIPDKALKLDTTTVEKLPRIRIVIGVLLGQGGPRINLRGETNVPGIYAAGECPGNIYGSYRVPGFMGHILTEGRIAGKYAAEYSKTVEQIDGDLAEVEEEKNRIYRFLTPKSDAISPLEVKKKIWEITGKYLFIVRNAKGLTQAITEIDKVRKNDLPKIQAVNIKCMNLDWVEAIEVPFMLDYAEMVARSALFREESRGCQYRDDFLKMDNKNWLCHTLLRKDLQTGEMRLTKAPVTMTQYKPPVEIGGKPIRI